MKEKIAELFEKTNAEAVLLRNSSSAPEYNFFYFSGLPFGHQSGSFLVLKPGKKPLLLATSLEHTKISGVKARQFRSRKQIEHFLRSEFKGIKKIGLNFDLYPHNAFSALKKILPAKKFLDVSKQLAKTREIKTASEIHKIALAAKVSEFAVQKLPGFFREGMREKEIALKLEALLRENGDNELAFPTIAASGRNASVPHYATGNVKITVGFLLVDFGAKHKNYCSDLSRTFFVGRPSQKQKGLYESVFHAKELAQELCVPGASCKKIFEETNRFLKKQAHSSLAHALGHGLGLEVHDFPYGFGPKSEDVLKQGMVLTIEPAIYGKFGGIRIEDDIVITKNKCRKLSNAPKELIEL